jgi:polysaccharide pyruvyl transferase WcaK-like protein
MCGENLGNQEHVRLIVVGGYGFDNLGDDLILRAALKSVREVIPNAKVTVLSNNPQETSGRHKGEVVCYSPEALVRQIIFRAMSGISLAYRNLVTPIPGRTFGQLCTSVRQADMVLSLGGGYLNDFSRSPYPQLRLSELAFLGFSVGRLVMCAHELGPFSRFTSILLARLAVKSVTYATVRDRGSLEVLSNLGFDGKRATQTADASWSYDPVGSLGLKVRRAGRGRLKVAVNLMPLQTIPDAYLSDRSGGEKATELNARVLAGVARCFELPNLKRTRLLHFLSMSSKDKMMAVRLRSLLDKRFKIDISDDLNSQYRALACSDVLIAMRMHSIIMAAQLGVLPIAIAGLPKVSDTMSDLRLSEYVLDINQFTEQKLQELLIRALVSSQRARDDMLKRVKALRKRANRSMQAVAVAGRA